MHGRYSGCPASGLEPSEDGSVALGVNGISGTSDPGDDWMKLTNFQESAEASLVEACKRFGVGLRDRQLLGASEPVVHGRVEGLEFWIYVDEAALIADGVEHRFEDHAGTTPERLEREFVGAVIDYLSRSAGGSES